MKNINLIWISIIILSGMVGIESCQSPGKASSSSKMLKFNFETGKGYDYEMITNMDQEIMGKSMQMDMSAYYSMDVKADNNNIKTITTSIDRFKLRMDVAGMNIAVDTDEPMTSTSDSLTEKNPLGMVNKLFGAIKGQRFSMNVNAEGKVLEITGFENMAERIADSMGLDQIKKTEMIEKFNQQFNASNMKEQFERFLYIFPNKEVKVGDTWQKNRESLGPMPGKYNSTYVVKEIEGDMVTLQESTTISSDNEQMKLNGEINGTLIIDSKTGLVVSADQDLKMISGSNNMKFELKGKTKIKGKAR